jgi:flagellar basal-body rod modification protein FlgD
MELVSDIAGNKLNSASPLGVPTNPRSAAELDSDDFFKLLITQLTNQDPMEPTGNEELLRQISSIRDIELSTNLSESLGALSGQQQFSASSSLIGQFVTGSQGNDGSVSQGMVIGVRFTGDGKPMLQLANGTELSIDKIATIESPLAVGQALVGQAVTGVDQRERSEPKVFEGTVTSAMLDDNGEAVLELDTGESVRLRDVLSVKQ